MTSQNLYTAHNNLSGIDTVCRPHFMMAEVFFNRWQYPRDRHMPYQAIIIKSSRPPASSHVCRWRSLAYFTYSCRRLLKTMKEGEHAAGTHLQLLSLTVHHASSIVLSKNKFWKCCASGRSKACTCRQPSVKVDAKKHLGLTRIHPRLGNRIPLKWTFILVEFVFNQGMKPFTLFMHPQTAEPEIRFKEEAHKRGKLIIRLTLFFHSSSTSTKYYSHQLQHTPHHTLTRHGINKVHLLLLESYVTDVRLYVIELDNHSSNHWFTPEYLKSPRHHIKSSNGNIAIVICMPYNP